MNIVNRITTFLKEAHIEARKVNWPTRRETVINTVLVIVFSLAVAALLGLFDLTFVRALERLIL